MLILAKELEPLLENRRSVRAEAIDDHLDVQQPVMTGVFYFTKYGVFNDGAARMYATNLPLLI